MEKPIVTVIIPCYNYGRYVAETLDSVLAQSFSAWECIVVDDGSSDNSKEVVLPYTLKDPRIKYHYQDNKGLPGARNKGIEMANGKYLQFLDADDIIEKDKIKLQVKCFEDNPELDFVYGGLRYFMDGKPDKLFFSASWINRPWTLTKSGKGRDLLKYLIISSVIMPLMPLIRKEAVEKIGRYKVNLRSCEDWEFWLRFANHNYNFKFLNAENTFGIMRLHPLSMTKNRTVMLSSMIEVRQIIEEMVEDDDLKQLNQKFLINDKIELAIVKQQHEGKRLGINYMKSEFRTKPGLRYFFFRLLLNIFPPKWSLFILSLVRMIMKRYYYFINQ
ncbi:MAG: glycosyltransferase [Bacteroidota bacterium]